MTVPEFTGENLLFIVGAPRSGTTWLQRLLASHPQIATGQETHLFAYIGPLLRNWRRALARELDPASATGRGGVGLGCYLVDEEYVGWVKLFLHGLLGSITRQAAPGQYFLEKTPSHSLYMREIRELLPRSRFIHIIRDPRDVTASLLAASESWGKAWAPRHSGEAAKEWIRHVQAARLAAEEMPPTAYREIHYEDLISAPIEVLDSLARFIGISWSRQEIGRAVDANRPEAIRRGGGTPIPLGGEYAEQRGPVAIDPASFVRSARAGAWKADLSLAQKINLWRLTRKTMQPYGYAWRFSDWL